MILLCVVVTATFGFYAPNPDALPEVAAKFLGFIATISSFGMIVLVVRNTSGIQRKIIKRLSLARASLETANNELELRVRERTQELKRSNEALLNFNHVAGHDLRAPLRGRSAGPVSSGRCAGER